MATSFSGGGSQSTRTTTDHREASGDSLLYNSKPYLAEMFSMRTYTRVDTFVQIRQKTWPPCDFENSDWSIFKKLLLKNVLIEQKIIIRWQNFQIKFTIPTDQLVKLTTH
jgi:hypothetical protein